MVVISEREFIDGFIFLCTFLYFLAFLQMNMCTFIIEKKVVKKRDIKVYCNTFYANCHETTIKQLKKKSKPCPGSFSAVERFRCDWGTLRRGVRVRYKLIFKDLVQKKFQNIFHIFKHWLCVKMIILDILGCMKYTIKINSFSFYLKKMCLLKNPLNCVCGLHL